MFIDNIDPIGDRDIFLMLRVKYCSNVTVKAVLIATKRFVIMFNDQTR